MTSATPSDARTQDHVPSQVATGRLMHLGEIAERTGLSHRTLRFYDESGLLTPTARSAGGFRLYSAEDLERLLLIRRMKPLGYSIAQMRQLLVIVGVVQPQEQASTGAPPEDLEDIDDFIASARQRRERLQRHLDWADDFIALLQRVRDGGTSAPQDMSGAPRHRPVK